MASSADAILARKDERRARESLERPSCRRFEDDLDTNSAVRLSS